VADPATVLQRGPRGLRGAVALVLRADRRGTALAAALQLVGAASGLALVLASKLALDAILAGTAATAGSLVPALLLLALASALSGTVGTLAAQQQRVLGERVGQEVWRLLLRACASVDLIAFDSPDFTQRLERVRSSAVSRPLSVVTSLLGLVGALAGVLAMVGALVSIEPLLVPLLLVAGVPAVLLSRRAARTEFRFNRSTSELGYRRNYFKFLLSHRAYAAEVRAFDTSADLRRRHAEVDAAYLEQLRAQVRRRQGYAVVGGLASSTALALALVAIVALVVRGSLGLADAGAAAIAARLLSGQLSGLFRGVGGLIEAAPFLADLDDFLAAAPPTAPRGATLPLRRGVTVEGASFSYPGRAAPAVHDVSVEVPAGHVVALVGENGSGKTTLAKLVAGLYEPDAGAVLWDGVPRSRHDLRASVTVLFQDFARYHLSLTDNVAISDTSRPTDAAAAEDAARRVGVGGLVDELPDGMATVLGLEVDQGSDLSGGQWQRVALARALYRRAPLVVLDEPSAALDPRAEHELFADVRRVLDGRSALLVSHRYSSVQLADHIYVMHHGRVVEHGSHEELVAAGGRYAELYALQAGAYADSRHLERTGPRVTAAVGPQGSSDQQSSAAPTKSQYSMAQRRPLDSLRVHSAGKREGTSGT
jgi:ATP-binding cassette subfamily B protein